MRHLKRFTALVLALLLCAALFSATAFAAQKTTPLKLGTWYKPFLSDGGKPTIYKVKFTEDKLVTLKWKGLADGRAVAPTFTTVYPGWLLENPSNEYDPEDWGYYRIEASGTETFVISAGTYFVYAEELIDYESDVRRNARRNADAPTAQFSVSAKKLAAPPSNYTPARAKTLKAGTKATLRYTPMKAHPCWFKIKLTKKQKLTVTRSPYLTVSIYYDNLACIYDSNTESEWRSEFKTTPEKITSKAKLDKGTYYIRVNPILGDFYSCFFANDVNFIKWN